MPTRAKTQKSVQNLKRANAIATVRSKRGYSATNYDVKPATPAKTLRRHFGQKYDGRKVRNNWRQTQEILNRMQVLSRSMIFGTLPDTRRRKRLTKKVLGLN